MPNPGLKSSPNLRTEKNDHLHIHSPLSWNKTDSSPAALLMTSSGQPSIKKKTRVSLWSRSLKPFSTIMLQSVSKIMIFFCSGFMSSSRWGVHYVTNSWPFTPAGSWCERLMSAILLTRSSWGRSRLNPTFDHFTSLISTLNSAYFCLDVWLSWSVKSMILQVVRGLFVRSKRYIIKYPSSRQLATFCQKFWSSLQQELITES